MDDTSQKRKAVKTGTVVKVSARKTVRVVIERQVRHPLYKKTIRLKKTYLVHDEKEECKAGDKVRIVDSRPVSKLKRWRVLEVVGKNTTAAAQADGGES